MLKEHLKDWMPDYYKGEHVSAIQSARDKELSYEDDKVDRIYDDMYASRAKDIDLWEKEYGITPTSEVLEERQAAVVAFMRGSNGALTIDKIKSIVAAFAGDDATTSVTEYPEDFLDAILITYASSVPMDVSVLKENLLSLMQAHVGLTISQNITDEVESALHFGIKLTGGYIRNAPIST